MGDRTTFIQTIGLLTALALLISLSSNTSHAGVVQGNDSIYTFNVSNCYTNTTTLDCNSTDIFYNCSITPFNFIEQVQFYINGTYYTTSRNDSEFYITHTKPVTVTDINSTYDFNRQRITDVDNKSVLDFETVSINWSCDVCDTTYNKTNTSCYTNNTMDAYYVSNDLCANDYNITEYCNYCDPDWTPRTGGIYECNVTNQKVVFYDDFNTCYAVTGLFEDSPPIDHNTTVDCSFYTTNMTCELDPNPYLTDRINMICEVPNNETWNCVTYVRSSLNSTQILQSNPEYKVTSTSLLSFTSPKQENRESFTNENTIVNGYYTNKNIETDRDFVVGMRCSNGGSTLISEYPITPEYRGLSTVMNRIVWAKENLTFLLVLIFVILVTISVIIGLLTRRGR